METITPLNEIKMPLRGIIYDMDGVTVNTMKHHYNWQKYIHEKMGDKSKGFKDYNDKWVENYNDIYADKGLAGLYDLISHVPWNKDGNEKEIWKLYEEYNSLNIADTIIKDGFNMKDIIHETYIRGRTTPKRMTRLRLGINTTKSRKSLDPILEKAGLENHFDTIVTYDDVLRCIVDGKMKQENIKTDNIEILRKLVPSNMKEYIEKPNSLSSMLTINAMGVHPSEVLVFEDTVNGIQAYKPIMMAPRPSPAYVVGVTWGFVKNEQKLIDAGADAIIDSPKEIIDLVEMLGGFK